LCAYVACGALMYPAELETCRTAAVLEHRSCLQPYDGHNVR
jgi:hypothetical protein